MHIIMESLNASILKIQRIDVENHSGNKNFILEIIDKKVELFEKLHGST